MVGNNSWNYEDREVFDKGRKEKIIFAWKPYKTDKGWRWLTNIRRVSTIEWVKDTSVLNSITSFLGLDLSGDQEVIRYESL